MIWLIAEAQTALMDSKRWMVVPVDMGGRKLVGFYRLYDFNVFCGNGAVVILLLDFLLLLTMTVTPQRDYNTLPHVIDFATLRHRADITNSQQKAPP